MIKISRKVAVIIILAIMILGVIGFGGIMKFQQITILSQSDMNGNSQQWQKEEMKNQLAYSKDALATIDQKIKAAATEDEKAVLQIERVNVAQQVELYQMAVDNGINMYTNGFKATLLNDIIKQKSELQTLESTAPEQMTKEQTARVALIKETIRQYTAILSTGDFAKYIEIKNKEIEQNTALTSEEKKLKEDTNLLWLKLDPKGTAGDDGISSMLPSTLTQIENYKRSLLYNVDYSSSNGIVKPLTPDGRKDVENNLAVMTYKAEHQMLNTQYNSSSQIQESAISGMFGFGLFMLVCMMLILAGGAISQEISTGSIKSLIISPTKRYKIFFAKLASLVTVGVFCALVLYLVTIVMTGIYFGFGSGSSFIFAVNGTASEMNFYLYRFAYLFVNFIDVLIYMMLAFMLSIVTRNTAASVGISIAIYFGGSIADTFIKYILRGEWVKFIPFSNMSLASRIFPDPSSLTANYMGTTAAVPSTLFSVVYIIVLVTCMGYIALDSFNRRDIK